MLRRLVRNAVEQVKLFKGKNQDKSVKVDTLPNNTEHRETWTQWFRDNFTFLVLCSFVLFMLLYNVYVLHYVKEDETYIAWSREATNLFMGALIGIITNSSRAPSRQQPSNRLIVQDSGSINLNPPPPADPADADVKVP